MFKNLRHAALSVTLAMLVVTGLTFSQQGPPPIAPKPSSGAAAASDATLTTTDITTNNVSTSKHGFAPKSPNDGTVFLNGLGAYSAPAASAADAPPASPNAMDDEFTGSSLDVKWVQNNVSGQTYTVGSGILSMVGPATGVDTVHAIEQTSPSTPWTFVTKCVTAMPTSSGTFFGGLSARESSSGKIYTWSIGNQGGNLLTFYRWNGGASAAFTNTSVGISMAVYMKLQDDGTNMVASHSMDGVNYVQDSSTTVVSTFTTAPNKIGLFIENNGAGVTSCDYFRRTQ